MILADKIIRLRKKNGWSQEELAEKMQVSRQAVSKWEGAQSVPDLDKILALGELFGVTTDYLLKDEMEDEELSDGAGAPVKRLTLAQANEFLRWRKTASVRIAAATFLCVIAAIPLMLLGAASTLPGSPVPENAAAAGGMIALLVLVAAAVAMFIHCGFKNAPYAFLDREPFETEYGVEGMAREWEKALRGMYVRFNIAATCVCILSPVPLFAGLYTGNEFLMVALLTVTMLLAGIGAGLFIVAGVQWASVQKLLKTGEFSPEGMRRNQKWEAISTAYWLLAVAIFLAWNFWTDAWDRTWIVWPVAGVLYAAIRCIGNLLASREQ